MAKPTNPTPIWATQANYTTGPAPLIGTPTKVSPGGAEVEGWKADQKPPAQWDNFTYNFHGEYINWVRLGSTAAGLDAHIIETDSTGESSIAKLSGGGTALGDSAGVFTSNASGACLTATDTIGSFAFLCAGSSSSAGQRTTQTGTGAAIEGILSGGSATGSALFGDAGPAGAIGVEGDGGTDGDGVSGAGGSTSGDGVVGDGNAVGNGVTGTGGSTGGAGVEGTSSVSARAGVEGIATNVNGVGVLGTTPASGGVTANAVRGATGTGDATGIRGDSTAGGGYAGLFHADTSAPKRAALRAVPQDADPTTHATGDVYYSSVTSTLKTRTVAGFQNNLVSDGGYAYGFNRSASGSQNSATFASKVSTGLASPHDPKVVGDVTLRVSVSVRNAGSALNTVRIRLRDVTAAVTIDTYDIRLDQTNALVINDLSTGHEKTLSIIREYTLPSTGARSFEVQMATATGGGTGVDYLNLSLEVTGVY